MPWFLSAAFAFQLNQCVTYCDVGSHPQGGLYCTVQSGKPCDLNLTPVPLCRTFALACRLPTTAMAASSSASQPRSGAGLMSLEMLLSYAAELPRLPLPRSTPPLDDSSSSTVESPQTIWSSPEQPHRSPTFSPVPDFEQGFFIPLEQTSETALYTDDGSVILTVRSSTPSRKRKRLQVKRACASEFLDRTAALKQVLQTACQVANKRCDQGRPCGRCVRC